MNEEIPKSYYAIIPANVRYDKELTPNSKLLYGEITALCNEKGFCWANNEYFSNLYGVSKVSISKWINQLVAKGYIFSEIIYKEGTKEILNRYLRIVNDPIKEKFNTPIKEKFKDNNTYNNNTINNINKKKKKETEFDVLIKDNFTNEEVINTIYEFIKMRKAIKKPLTTRGLELIIKKLYKMTSNVDEQIEILNNSIMNNWQGIFELKKNKNNNSKGNFDDFKNLWEEAKQYDEQAGNNTNNNPFGW